MGGHEGPGGRFELAGVVEASAGCQRAGCRRDAARNPATARRATNGRTPCPRTTILADLILCSEAADATLDLLKRDPRYAVDKAFAHYLEVFKTQGFNPLETVEVQAMGMGSPARFQLRVPTWRQTLVAAADRKST